MNVEDLWIGDFLKLIETGQIGNYKGQDRNQLIITINSENISVDKNMVCLATPQEIESSQSRQQKKEKTVAAKINHFPFEKTLDLHIDKLDKNIMNGDPNRILDFQIETCLNYIKQAFAQRAPCVTVIHGRGSGILRKEIDFLLAGLKEVKHHHTVNQGGAQEVWLNI